MHKKIIDEAETFKLNPDLKISITRLGSVGEWPIVTIDNLYANPDAVRQLALDIPPCFNSKSLVNNFPGGRIDSIFSLAHFGPLFNDIIKEVWPSTWSKMPDNYIIEKLSSATFIVNVMQDEWIKPRVPHVDHIDPNAFAGTVFLNTPDECEGGTGFYSFNNKFTGNGSELRKSTTDTEPYNEFVTDSVGDWKLEHIAEMKYNRFILYSSKLYHHPYIKPGKYINDLYRLNQMFFIQ